MNAFWFKNTLDQWQRSPESDGKAIFMRAAADLWAHQSTNNAVFGDFLDYLGRKNQNPLFDPNSGLYLGPLLPVEFFKNQSVRTGLVHGRHVDSGQEEISNARQSGTDALIFESSTTSGQTPSLHWVPEPEVYRLSLKQGFEAFFGPIQGRPVLGLLPGYLDRPRASLVYMLRELARENPPELYGLHKEADALMQDIQILAKAKQEHFLFGVTHALLSLALKGTKAAWTRNLFSYTRIIETGGMKGHGPEWVREEVHQQLYSGLKPLAVHSEYGMTELLSQAYALEQGSFRAPPWLQVQIRETQDVLSLAPPGRTGRIALVDLANVHSCAFLLTSDLGRMLPDGSFQVLGRMDSAEIRGCNLMI